MKHLYVAFSLENSCSEQAKRGMDDASKTIAQGAPVRLIRVVFAVVGHYPKRIALGTTKCCNTQLMVYYYTSYEVRTPAFFGASCRQTQRANKTTCGAQCHSKKTETKHDRHERPVRKRKKVTKFALHAVLRLLQLDGEAFGELDVSTVISSNGLEPYSAGHRALKFLSKMKITIIY